MNWKSWISSRRPWSKFLPSPRLAAGNFFSLGFVRATDALVFLLLTPVIIRRIGIDHFGIIAFVQVFLNYGKTIVDYGFNISGVRAVALAKGDNRLLGQIVADVLTTRLLTGLGCTALLAGLTVIIPYLHPYAPVFYWGLPVLAAHAVFTDWFFIGLQRTQYLAVANLIARAAFAGLVLWQVQEQADYIYILAFYGATGLAAGIGMIFFIYNKFQINLQMPRMAKVLHYLRDDFRLLLTNGSIEFNGSYAILALNVLTTHALTGYFSVMQKLIQPLRFLLVIFSQTIFPMVVGRLEAGLSAVRAFLRQAMRLFAPLPVIACGVLFLAAGPLMFFFTGESRSALIWNFRLYLVVPLIVLLNIPAYQVLLAYERKSDYARVYLWSLLLNLVGSVFLISTLGLTGAVLSLVVVEGFTTAGLHWQVNRKRGSLQLE
jgi:PST family polysaccharide transporter